MSLVSIAPGRQHKAKDRTRDTYYWKTVSIVIARIAKVLPHKLTLLGDMMIYAVQILGHGKGGLCQGQNRLLAHQGRRGGGGKVRLVSWTYWAPLH